MEMIAFTSKLTRAGIYLSRASMDGKTSLAGQLFLSAL